MVMPKLNKEDKKLFFDKLHPIQEQYNSDVVAKNFVYAERCKKISTQEFILKNKNKLLSLREKLGIS